MQRQKKQIGFTLIELLIVLMVVGIIGAIAYPSYIEQIRKARRADAQIKLQDLAQLQESFFSRNFSYANNLSGLLGGSANTIDSDDAFYQLSIVSALGITGAACLGTNASPCNSYTIEAVPVVGTSQMNDTKCSRFTLDNMGRKTAENVLSSTDNTTLCW